MTDEVPAWPQLRARTTAPGYRSAVGALRWSDETGEDPASPAVGACRFRYALQNRLLVDDDDGAVHVQDEHWAYLRGAGGRMVRHRVRSGSAVEHPFGHPWTLLGNGLDRGELFTTPTDFFEATGPAVAVTVAGRRAWDVELAPPPHKPSPLRIAVDDLTGTLLRMVGAEGALVVEMTEFTPHAPVADSDFVWTGPFEEYEVAPPVRPEPAPLDEDEIAYLRERVSLLAALTGAAERQREVLGAVVAAGDPDAAVTAVSGLLGVRKTQAVMVLDMQVRRFCRSSRARLAEELAELREVLRRAEG